jgi:hypothetical protein
MKAKEAIAILTIYLTVYAALFLSGVSATILACMFLASPFLIVLGIYIILKDDQNQYPELDCKDEWGYKDKTKDELDLF